MKMMQGMKLKLTTNDWERLQSLRQRFLKNESENYWKDLRDLELYDAVYAQRIKWKWNAVLQDLDQLHWKPSSHQIFDWGCGTGIASRTVSSWSAIDNVHLFDQSTLAMAFAREKHLQQKNNIVSCSELFSPTLPTLFLISHVISELDSSELQELAIIAARAHDVIWVEPGSHELSRTLGSLREIFLEAGHHLIAPCVQEQSCPMFEKKHHRDWCHFFAIPPTEIFQSAFWHEASRQLGIDLRSLPYSYLVFSRQKNFSFPKNAERLIGHPRTLKAHGKLFCCGASGLCERLLQKRDHPALFKKLIKEKERGLFCWKLNEAERIVEGKKA